MSNYLETVNRTKVSAELLGEVLKMHADMPAKDRPVFEVRAIRLFEFLDNKGLGGKDRKMLAVAIDFRVTALARLQKDAGLRAWSMPGQEPGVVSISFDMLRAAADEPLVEDAAGQAAFDLDSFKRRLLAITDADGRA